MGKVLMLRIWIVRGLIALAALFLIAQVVPYGRRHSNPPTTHQPAWDSPQTAASFEATCADCHSNRTKWPWYSHIAPASWLVQHDVDEGRSQFNVSEPPGRRNEADEAAEMVLDRKMPPAKYLLLHPQARLTPESRSVLAKGLAATFGGEAGEHEQADGN